MRPPFQSIALLLIAAAAPAATIQMNDGRTLTGAVGKTSGVALDPNNATPQNGEVRVERIVIIDDGLRRTYVSQNNIRAIVDDDAEPQIKIRLWQNIAKRRGIIGRVGQQVSVTPFDDFGRRVYRMQGGKDGTITVVQGITEITPTYTRVRGLEVDPKAYVWDMRIATSSIPRDRLAAILAGSTQPSDVDGRLQIVRLYIQSQRYRDARQELEAILRDNPQMDDLRGEVRQLRQLGARAILDEIELRRSAGQHRLVRALLENFPADEVAGVTLQRVRELVDELNQRDAERAKIVRLIDGVLDAVDAPGAVAVAKQVLAEIAAELNEASMGRMAAFTRLAEGRALSNERKAALAISGWLLGSNRATDNLAVAVSLFDVRQKVVEYLNSSSGEQRERLLNEIRELEGGTPERVAQLLKLMKPPKRTAEDALRGPGFYELTTTVGDDEVRYLVQLPPEYDPLRSYPAIVTLPGVGFLPERMIDYWAGAPAPPADEEAKEQGRVGQRRGQAMRRGCITIAVDWVQPKQFKYDYSDREHAAVLASLRDATRRFAIDSDRVFLSGHDAGGDAAWDIALAHPDHWAGVMPFLARSKKYTRFYDENAKLLPWYFVAGELDGGKMALNAPELDGYLKKAGYDVTIAEFLGRGYEPFNDEIQRLFDWMGRQERDPAPERFAAETMRPWDNYFYWLECDGLPPRAMVHPLLWTKKAPPNRARAVKIEGRKYEGNKLGARVRADRVTFWLSPDVVDFDQPIDLEINGRSVVRRDAPVRPDIAVLLEDARTRGDRRRPFWAKHVVE